MSLRIKIELAKKGQASDCLNCIKDSKLWEAYFKKNTTAEDDIEQMILKRQIHVALNENNDCIGFMGVIHNGCFRKFSYLSLIAVEKRYRGNGIGRKLIDRFEEIGFTQADRAFLLVSDFNTKAQEFYHKLGYLQAGEIPNLYKMGVNEHLMIKYEN